MIDSKIKEQIMYKKTPSTEIFRKSFIGMFWGELGVLALTEICRSNFP